MPQVRGMSRSSRAIVTDYRKGVYRKPILNATITLKWKECMSDPQSPKTVMGFQLRHRTLGIYQGSAVELAFWHPSSGMPEYGICCFQSQDKAQAYVDFLSSPQCLEPLNHEDFTIEPFDQELHERLKSDNPMTSAWELGR